MKFILIMMGFLLGFTPVLGQAKQNKACPDLSVIQHAWNQLSVAEEEEPGVYAVMTALPTVVASNTLWYVGTEPIPAKDKVTALIKGQLNVKVTFLQYSKDAAEFMDLYSCIYESVGGKVVALGLMFPGQQKPSVSTLHGVASLNR